MEAEQSVEPTGTNRSNPPDPLRLWATSPLGHFAFGPLPAFGPVAFGQPEHRPRAAASARGRTPPARRRPPVARRFLTPPHSQIPANGPTHEPPDQSPGDPSAGILRPRPRVTRGTSWRFGQPGGHSEGHNTRSHPELGRENPQRRWYCRSSGGRAGRRQARQTPNPDPTRQPHPIPTPSRSQPTAHRRGVEQPGSSSGS